MQAPLRRTGDSRSLTINARPNQEAIISEVFDSSAAAIGATPLVRLDRLTKAHGL
ncbi:hypothetical protein [Burkholderia puraquae]|uniref:hypothetical protein n=1 Tax=Burkholderia puraquae TaxID=1904757 RepID=UPI001AD7F3EB|nr:hypothetical protein [Burkholderia puraquae]